jgi:hypothetical protein
MTQQCVKNTSEKPPLKNESLMAQLPLVIVYSVMHFWMITAVGVMNGVGTIGIWNRNLVKDTEADTNLLLD